MKEINREYNLIKSTMYNRQNYWGYWRASNETSSPPFQSSYRCVFLVHFTFRKSVQLQFRNPKVNYSIAIHKDFVLHHRQSSIAIHNLQNDSINPPSTQTTSSYQLVVAMHCLIKHTHLHSNKHYRTTTTAIRISCLTHAPSLNLSRASFICS